MTHQDANIVGFNVRAQGRRKSRFPGKTVVEANAFMDYFVEGVNYKIPFSDLLVALGATGVLQQSGAVTGVPVLDIQGNINNIRNIELSVGLTGTVSPENGVELKTALLPGADGVPVLIDQATNPKFRGIEAGNGISVAVSGEAIQIAATGVPVTTKTVIVADISDFPAAIGGVITLADETEYFLVNDIVTADSFRFGNNCAINAGEPTVITLTYTGINPMFLMENTVARVLNISLDCPNSDLMDIDQGFLSFSLCAVDNCINLGTIDAAFQVTIRNCFFSNVTGSGFTFTGANTLFNCDDVFVDMVGDFTLFDLGVATFDNFSITDSFFQFDAGGLLGTFLSGAAADANINTGRLGAVTNCRITDVATGLTGITPEDDQWAFSINDILKDTFRNALIAFTGNATNTVIAVVSTPVLIAGTWVGQTASGYTTDAAGKVTYDASKPADAVVTINMSAIKVVGGATGDYIFQLFLNGVSVPDSDTTVTLSTGSSTQLSLIWSLELQPTDFLEVFVESVVGIDDILVTEAQFRVSNG